MAKLKSKRVKVLAGVIKQLVDEDISRIYLTIRNSLKMSAAVRIDGNDTNINDNSGILYPGDSIVLNGVASTVSVWCLTDVETYVNVIEVIG